MKRGNTACLRWLLVVGFLGGVAFADDAPERSELRFPDLPGGITLQCDFGLDSRLAESAVWPTLWVGRAWRGGLDAVAVVGRPGPQTPFVEAGAAAGELGLILVPAAVEPLPGSAFSVVTLFASDPSMAAPWRYLRGTRLEVVEPISGEDESLDLPPNPALAGVEIARGGRYDLAAHRWAMDRKLTLLGGESAFDPRQPGPAVPRTRTLVFARDATVDGIRDALVNGRTAVWNGGSIYGSSEHLEPLFQRSIEIINPRLTIRGKGRVLVQIRNRAPVDFELRLSPRLPELDVPFRVWLPAGKVVAMEARCLSERVSGEFEMAVACRVINLVAERGRPLRTALRLRVTYEPR